MNYFFDTYAIIEMLKGNPMYERFQNETITTSTLNIAEVHYYLLRIYDEKKAKYWIEELKLNITNIVKTQEAIEASKLKFSHKKEKLSYIDCIGYTLAKKMNLRFLTGDKEFEKKANVEFIK